MELSIILPPKTTFASNGGHLSLLDTAIQEYPGWTEAEQYINCNNKKEPLTLFTDGQTDGQTDRAVLGVPFLNGTNILTLLSIVKILTPDCLASCASPPASFLSGTPRLSPKPSQTGLRPKTKGRSARIRRASASSACSDANRKKINVTIVMDWIYRPEWGRD